MTAGGQPFRGKVPGLPEATVPGNARAERFRRTAPQKKQTATAFGDVAKGETGGGKSPPRDWQQERHGKPHREQCRIRDTAGGATPGAGFGPRYPGWQL